MAIKLKVRSKEKQIIVPIRFRRALESEAPGLDLPDVDERGFAMGKRAQTWGAKDIQGAMVAVTTGQTVRLRVVTADIEGDVDPDDVDAGFPPLFATSTDPKLVAVIDPPNGGPLFGGIFSIKGLLDTRNSPVAVQIHLGSREGPVLGELEPHIFNLLHLRCLVHRTFINDQGPADSSPEHLSDIFRVANAIWRHAGIEFSHRIASGNVSVRASETGTVTLFKRTEGNGRLREVLPIFNSPHRAEQVVNIYLVHRLKDLELPGDTTMFGGTISNKFRPQVNPGTLLADDSPPETLAHELGHFLTLEHSDQDPSNGNRIRTDS